MNEEVVREQFLPVPREDVWEALSDPAGLQEWFAEDAELELEPGGEARFRFADGEERAGFVEEATAPERLAFWWRSTGDDEEPLSRVAITLEEADGGTLLRVVESRNALRVESVLLPFNGSQGTTGPQLRASASLTTIG